MISPPADDLAAQITDEDAAGNPALGQYRAEALKVQEKRTKLAKSLTLSPLNQAKAVAVEAENTAKLNIDDLDAKAADINKKLADLDNLDADGNGKMDATEKSGGFLGFGQKPTDRALQLQSQRAELQKQADAIASQRGTLAADLTKGKDGAPDGKIIAAKEKAQAEHDIAAAQFTENDINGAIEQRTAWLAKNGKDAATDEHLKNLTAAQSRLGYDKSEAFTARKEAEDRQKQIETGATDAAATAAKGGKVNLKVNGRDLIQNPVTPDEVAAFQSEADALKADREKLDSSDPAALTKFNDRVKALNAAAEQIQATAQFQNTYAEKVAKEANQQALVTRNAERLIELEDQDKTAAPGRQRPTAAKDYLAAYQKPEIAAAVQAKALALRADRAAASKDWTSGAGYRVNVDGQFQINPLSIAPDFVRDAENKKAAVTVYSTARGAKIDPATGKTPVVKQGALPAPDYREALRSAVADKTLTQEQADRLSATYAQNIALTEADALRRVINRGDFQAAYAAEAAKPIAAGQLGKDVSIQQAAREWLKKDPTLLDAALDNAKRVATGALSTLPGNSEIALVGRLVGSKGMEKFGLENLKYLSEQGDQRRDEALSAQVAQGIGSSVGFALGMAAGGPLTRGAAAVTIKSMRAAGAGKSAGTLVKLFNALPEAASGKTAAKFVGELGKKAPILWSGGTTQAAQSMEEMNRLGIPKEDQWLGLAFAGATGATEIFSPVGKWADRLAGKEKGAAGQFLLNLVNESAEESAQETIQQVLSNIQDVAQDPAAAAEADKTGVINRLFQGVGQAALVAALSAGGMTAGTTAVNQLTPQKVKNEKGETVTIIPALANLSAAIAQQKAHAQNTETLASIQAARITLAPALATIENRDYKAIAEKINKANPTQDGTPTTTPEQVARAAALVTPPSDLPALRAEVAKTKATIEEAKTRRDTATVRTATSQAITAEHALATAEAEHLAAHGLAQTARQQIDQLPDADPAVFPSTGQELPQTTAARDQIRTAAEAITRVGMGAPLEQLTTAQLAALEPLAQEIDGPIFTPLAGVPVLTDTARQWLTQNTPAAARLFPESEAQMIAKIEAALAEADIANAAPTPPVAPPSQVPTPGATAVPPVTPSVQKPTVVVAAVPAPVAPAQTGSIDIPYDTAYQPAQGGAVVRSQGSAPIIDLAGRKIVVRIINGVRVPFYLSSGNGGKKGVAAGKWYPFFGIAGSWINKTSDAEINNYYGSDLLRAEAQRLDSEIGDIRSDKSHPRVSGASGQHLAFINEGLTPTENDTNDTKANLRKNIDATLARLAASSPAPATPAPPAPASTPATVTYTDAQNQKQTIALPADATTSDGQPVKTAAQARQWTAENMPGRVSDVEFTPALSQETGTVGAQAAMTEGAPAAPESTSSQEPPVGDAAAPTDKTEAQKPAPAGSTPAPESNEDRAAHIASEGFNPEDTKTTLARVQGFAQRVAHLFPGGVHVNTAAEDAEPGRELSGGVHLDTATNRLTISPADVENQTAQLTPARVRGLITHEFLHRVLVDLAGREQIDPAGLWDSFTPATQAAVTKVYDPNGKAAAYMADPIRAGHEALRMFMEGRVTLNDDGRITFEGANTPSDLVLDKGSMAQLAAVIEKIRAYLTDLVTSLKRDGNDRETIQATQAALDQAEAFARQLAKAQAAAAQAAPLSEQSRSENQPTNPNGQSQKEEIPQAALLNQQATPPASAAQPATQGVPSPVATPAAKPGETGLPFAVSYDSATGKVSNDTKIQLAAQLGVEPAAIGTVETVTHKGRTVQVVNVLTQADQSATSHNPDGTIRPGYPQSLQPRDRSGAEYLAQQRRIAGNPNLAEEALTGTTDRGTPIMAIVDGKPVTVMGNGRANAKTLMHASPDFAAARNRYLAGLPALATAKGITANIGTTGQPVLTRVLLTPLSTADLRTLSQESNEFAGQQTNATEQAKIDAGRLTPTILARINPDYDLAAAANADFRAEAAQAIAGRGANLTEDEILRRVRNALFAKAYADTDAGMSAFARLATEQEDGVRSLVGGLMEAAPAIASLRQAIADGTLHPVDPSAEIGRAVQDIAVALRDRPSRLSASAAIDALVDQGELGGISERSAEADTILRALVARRRNASAIADYLDAYINATYAAGDPSVEDMFGAPAPTKAGIAKQADAASPVQPVRLNSNRYETKYTQGQDEYIYTGPALVDWRTANHPEAAIVNPITPTLDPDSKVDALFALTQANIPLVSRILSDLKLIGLDGKHSAKLPERIQAKASRPSIREEKPWHDIEHVRDGLRFKVGLTFFNKIPQIARVLADNGVEIIKFDTKKMFAPKAFGWRFVAWDIRMPNGQLVEFYSPVPEMDDKAVKGPNHDLFEKWRNVSSDTLAANEMLFEERKNDIFTSETRYGNAFDASLTRMGYSDRRAAEAAFANSIALAESVTRAKRSASSTAPAVPLVQAPAADIRIGGNVDSSIADPSSATKTDSFFAVEDSFDSDGLIAPLNTTEPAAGQGAVDEIAPQSYQIPQDAITLQSKNQGMLRHVTETIPADTGRRAGAVKYWKAVNLLSQPVATEQLYLLPDSTRGPSGTLAAGNDTTPRSAGRTGRRVVAPLTPDQLRETPAAKLAADALTTPLDWPSYAATVQAALTANSGRISSIFHHLAPAGLPAFDVRGARIDTPRDFAILAQSIGSPYQESIKVAFLGRTNRIVYSEVLTLGVLNASNVSGHLFVLAKARAEAMGIKSSRVILSHNHPSGTTMPSSADARVTPVLANHAEQAGLTVVDHIITDGGAEYYSFREAGRMSGGGMDTYGQKASSGPTKPTAQAQAAQDRQYSPRDWELAPRSRLSQFGEPQHLRALAEALRQGRPQDGHLILTNSSNRVVAIEQIADYATKTETELATLVANRAAIEGANAFMLRHSADTDGVKAMRITRHFRGVADTINLTFLDAVHGNPNETAGGQSTYREMGLLEDGPKPLLSNRVSTAGMDDLFGFAAANPDQFNTTLTGDDLNRIQNEPTADNANRAPDSRPAPATAPRRTTRPGRNASRMGDDLLGLFGPTSEQPGAPTAPEQPAGTPPNAGQGDTGIRPPAPDQSGKPDGGGSTALDANGQLANGASQRPGDGPVDAAARAENERVAVMARRAAEHEARPVNERNHVIQPGDTLAPRGIKTRLRTNIAAIQLLKTLETENRAATPAEKRQLAQYVGWGGIPQVFDRITAEDRERMERYRTRGSTWEREYYAPAMEKNAKWAEAWGEAYDQLEKILTPEEWEAARNSVENAHYTAPGVIRSMWEMVRRLGFDAGRVLEPAGGVGHYYGLMPQDMATRSELHGVELDSISGRIMAKLYPEAKIQATTGFESARLPDNSFDLVISNVPFSENGPYDPAHPKLNLHNYFFAKALDKVRPGGIIAFITTNHTLDSQAQQRAYLAERGNLVASFRLPNNAFKENAATEVVTDIIFIQKKGDGAARSRNSWANVTTVGSAEVTTQDANGNDVIENKPIVVNEYYDAHPGNVLGTHTLGGSMYRADSYTVEPIDGADLTQQLADAVQTLPEGIMQPAAPSEAGPAANLYTGRAKDGSFTLDPATGEVKIINGSTLISLPEGITSTKAALFIPLRDAYVQHLADMANPEVTDEQIAERASNLRKLYDRFTTQYGPLNVRGKKGNTNLETDPDYWVTMGAENWDEKAEQWTPGPIFTTRTIRPFRAPTSVENPIDALRASVAIKGAPDLNYMAGLLNQTPEEARAALLATGQVFEDPKAGTLTYAPTYLSGNVRQKLAIAERAAANDPARYQRNVDALRPVIPEAIPLDRASIVMGAAWIHPEAVRAFVHKILNSPGRSSLKLEKFRLNIAYENWGGSDGWRIQAEQGWRKQPLNSKLGGGGWTALDLIEAAFNLRTPLVWKEEGSGKNVKKVMDIEATAAAKEAQDNIRAEFDTFIKGDQPLALEYAGEESTRPMGEWTSILYNDALNSHVDPQFDASLLQLPTAAPHVMLPYEQGGLGDHQRRAILRGITERRVLLAHGVGAGKTNELIGIAHEWKRLGFANKPLVVVQNATLNQFATSARRMFPAARILVASKDDLAGDKRKPFMARIASGDWDMVIMAQSSFNLIPDDPAYEAKIIAEQLREMEDALADAIRESNDPDKDPTVKQLVKDINGWRTKLQKATDRKTDNVLTFQQLGVDGILIDEIHNYKKVPFFTKMTRVAGIDRGHSERATSAWLKLRYIQEKNQGRNIVTASGTPVTNTLAEAWNMIRLVNPEALKEFKVDTFDQFAANFGQVIDNFEMNPAGKYIIRKRFAKFQNGQAFIRFVRSTMDVAMGLELGKPKIEGGGPEAVAIPATKATADYMAHLVSAYEQFQALEPKDKKELSFIPLVIYGTAKAAAIDMRLIDENAKDDPASKVNSMLRDAVALWKETADRKATQLIFSDSYRKIDTTQLDDFTGGRAVSIEEDTSEDTADTEDGSTPKEEAAPGFNLYEDIRQKLINAGVPASEIAVITDAKNDDQRDALFKKVNDGSVRFLIGSTQKMGVGVNVQQRAIALHNLDVPWTPADYEQRLGRVHRSGNMHRGLGIPVKLRNYGMRGTLDAGRWQLIETKSTFVQQFLMGELEADSFDDPFGESVASAAQMKAMFSGDERQLRLIQLAQEIKQARMQVTAQMNRAARVAQDARQAQYVVQMIAAERDGLAKQKTEIDAALAQPFSLTLTGKTFTDTKEAAKHITGLIDAQKADMTRLEIGMDTSSKTRALARGTIHGQPFNLFGTVVFPAGQNPDYTATAQLIRVNEKGNETVSLERIVTSGGGHAVIDLPATEAARLTRSIAIREEELTQKAALAADLSARAATATESPVAKELAAKEAELAQLQAELMDDGAGATAEFMDALRESPITSRITPGTPVGAQPVRLLSNRFDPAQVTFDLSAEPVPAEVSFQARALPAADATKAQLVKDAIPLADQIARRFSVIGYDSDDLKQEARQQLIKAAQAYEDRTRPFRPYAATAIRNHLQDLVKKAQVRNRRDGGSLDTPLSADTTDTRGALTPDQNATDPARAAEQADTAKLLDDLMQELPDLPRAIVRERMAGDDFETIGQRHGMTKQGAEQRFKSALGLTRARFRARLRQNDEADSLREDPAQPLRLNSAPARIYNPGEYPDTLATVHRHTTVSALRSASLQPGQTLVPLAPQNGDTTQVSPDYRDAKANGNALAALRVVKSAAKKKTMDDLRALVATLPKPPTFVPVSNRDVGTAFNALPGAYAEYLAAKLSSTTDRGIVKISGAPNTGAALTDRRNKVHTFAGPVDRNAYYIIADDVYTSGDTVTALIDYIRSNGGRVEAVTTLADSQAHNYLKPRAQDVEKILAKAAVSAEEFTNAVGFPITRLTGSEAYRLANLERWSGIKGIRDRFSPIGSGTSQQGSAGDSGQGQLNLLSQPYTPAPGDDEATRQALTILAKSKGLDAAALEAAYDKALSESHSNRTVGNPKLANPAGPDDATRSVLHSVDEQRRNDMERESHDLWKAEAKRRIAADPDAVVRDLLEQARNGDDIAANPVGVKAAQIMVARLSREAVTSGDRRKLHDAQTLAYAYRIQGSEQARALAARRDPFQTPAERHREFIAGLIFTPSADMRKAIAKAWTPRAKQAEIEKLSRQLALAIAAKQTAEAKALTPQADPEQVRTLEQRIAQLQGQIGEARRKADQQELLHKANDERLAQVEKALAKTGVTISDLLANEAEMRLRGAEIIGNLANAQNWDATKRRVMELANKGWTGAEIIKKLATSEANAKAIYEEARAATREIYRQRLSQQGNEQLKNLTDFTSLQLKLFSQPFRLNSAPAEDAERAALIEAKLDALMNQMGLPAWDQLDTPARTERVRRGKAQKRRAKPTPGTTPTAQPTSFPEVTDEQLDAIRRERATGSQAAFDDPNPRPAPSPEIPATGGPVGSLENDAANANRGPGSVAYPATGGKAPAATPPLNRQMELTDDPDYLPPAFDIADPIHVRHAVRTIQAIDAKFSDQAHEFWINSILSGPLTQSANVIGNTMNAAMALGLRRTMEASINDLFLHRSDLPHVAELRHMARAIIPAFARAKANAMAAFSTESSIFDKDILDAQITLGAGMGFDDRNAIRATIAGTKGRLIRLPGRILGAVDDFTKTMTASMEAAAHAYRIAKAEGLTGPAMEKRMKGLINLPGSAAWIAAHESATRLAFQEEADEKRVVGSVSKAAHAVQRIPGMRYLVPFVRTPLNIFAQGIRQSPFGSFILAAKYADALRLKMKDGKPITDSFAAPEQLERVIEQMLAWTMTALLAGAAGGDDDDEDKLFLITGAATEQSAGLRALQTRTGTQPYTIRIGNFSFAYGRIEPLATTLGVTIDALTAAKYADKAGQSRFVAAMGGLVKSIVAQSENKTMLKGVADFMAAVDSFRREKDITSGTAAGVQRWMGSFLSSWVPNLLRQPLRVADPYVRQTGGTSTTEQLAESILPATAPRAIDAYGRDVEKGGSVLWRLAVPIDVRNRPEMQRADALLTNWNQKQTDPGEQYAPAPLPRRMQIEGTWRTLTDSELERYARRTGILATNLLRNAALNVANPTEEDIKRIQRAFTTARTIAKREQFGATARE